MEAISTSSIRAGDKTAVLHKTVDENVRAGDKTAVLHKTVDENVEQASGSHQSNRCQINSHIVTMIVIEIEFFVLQLVDDVPKPHDTQRKWN